MAKFTRMRCSQPRRHLHQHQRPLPQPHLHLQPRPLRRPLRLSAPLQGLLPRQGRAQPRRRGLSRAALRYQLKSYNSYKVTTNSLRIASGLLWLCNRFVLFPTRNRRFSATARTVDKVSAEPNNGRSHGSTSHITRVPPEDSGLRPRPFCVIDFFTKNNVPEGLERATNGDNPPGGQQRTTKGKLQHPIEPRHGDPGHRHHVVKLDGT